MQGSTRSLPFNQLKIRLKIPLYKAYLSIRIRSPPKGVLLSSILISSLGPGDVLW